MNRKRVLPESEDEAEFDDSPAPAPAPKAKSISTSAGGSSSGGASIEIKKKKSASAPTASKSSAPSKGKAPAPAASDSDAGDDDDVPLTTLRTKRKGRPGPAELSDDSEDDVPLTKIKQAAAKPKSSKAKENQGKPAKKEKAPAPPKEKKPRRSENGGGAGKKRGPAVKTAWSVLSDTEKGQLVNKLLCRWWYVMEWPRPEDIIPPPPQHEALDGYPGVYVCVEGDSIGQILDNRDQTDCPCFTNFARKDASELKDMLKTALEKQLEALKEHWGEGTKRGVERHIKDELSWLRKVNPADADREAKKELARASLEL